MRTEVKRPRLLGDGTTDLAGWVLRYAVTLVMGASRCQLLTVIVMVLTGASQANDEPEVVHWSGLPRQHATVAGFDERDFIKALRQEGAMQLCFVTDIMELSSGVNIRNEPWASYSFRCTGDKSQEIQKADCIHADSRTSCTLWLD